MEAQVRTYADSSLDREVLEVRLEQHVYRCPALIGKRYRIYKVLSAGGFGMLFVGEDRYLFNKQVLIKANLYPRRLFKNPRDKAVDRHISEGRWRMEHESRMLLQAYNRGISGTPILVDKVIDASLDLYGPHTDEQGNQFYVSHTDPQTNRPVWEDEPYLVMSYVQGRPLKEALQHEIFRNNLLGNCKQLILQIGRVLQRFHEPRDNGQGQKIYFIYQDLKPENVIFTQEKDYVLIDFGSFAVGLDGKMVINTQVGTPGYQPPEFTDRNFSAEKIDARADIFSLGSTVYHVLSSQPPQQDAQGDAVLDWKALKQVPQTWQDWLAGATAPRVEDRFATMQETVKQAHNLPSRIRS